MWRGRPRPRTRKSPPAQMVRVWRTEHRIMARGFSMRKVVLAAVSVLALFVAGFAASLITSCRQAGALMQDLQELNSAENPTGFFASLKQKYGDKLKSDPNCTSDLCGYDLVVTNRIPYSSRLFRHTELSASFVIRHSALTVVTLQYRTARTEALSPLVWVQEDFCTTATESSDVFGVDPHGRDLRQISHGLVEFGQRATGEEKKAALALNLDCLTSLRGCRDISDLLPMVWKWTGPGAISSRMRSSGDSIEERSRPLAD